VSVPASKHDPAATPTLQATGTATPTLDSTAAPMPRPTARAVAGSTIPTPMPTPAVGSAFVFKQHTNPARPVVSIVRVRMRPTPFFRRNRRWLVDEGTCRCADGRSGTGHLGGRGRVRGNRRRRPTDRRGRSLWTVPGRRNEDRRIPNFKDYLGVTFGNETIVDKPEASHIVSLDCLGFVSVTFDY